MRRGAAALVKKASRPFLTALSAERIAVPAMRYYLKSLISQAFQTAVTCIRGGPFLPAVRSHRGSDVPPARHSLPRRRSATPRAPLLPGQLAWFPCILTVLTAPRLAARGGCLLDFALLRFRSGHYISCFLSLGSSTTTAVPERSRKAAHRPRLLSSPVLGLEDAWPVVRIWKVQLA